MNEAIFFLAGIIATVLVSPPGIELVQRYRRHITWRSFTKAVRHTLSQLEAASWRPDVIVGLNSGIVPASVLALNLRVPELLFYDCLPQYRAGVRVANPIRGMQIDLRDKNVLVIDDQAYTGKSLEILYGHLVTTGNADPTRIRRHALFTYEGGAGPIPLEIPPFGHVRGGVKEMPWVISESIKPFWKNRS